MENPEKDRNSDDAKRVSLDRDNIFGAMRSKQYDRAAALIESARQAWPATEMHDLLALEAQLRRATGHLRDCIELMRQARDRAPTWLPHLCCLADYLMEDEQWAEAETVLDELIRLSEAMDEHYFLDDAQFSKMMCLKNLKRDAEIAVVKSRIKPGSEFIRRDGTYRLDDFD